MDVIKYSARYISGNKLSMSKPALDILSQLVSVFVPYHKLFFQFDNKKAEEISRKRSQILEKIEHEMKKYSIGDVYILGTVMQMVEIIIHLIPSRMALEY